MTYTSSEATANVILLSMYARHVDDGESTILKIVVGAVAAVFIGIWALIIKAGEAKREEERLQMVSRKYSGELASSISQKMFWQGQTEEQLRDSLGPPAAIDVKVLKTKRREIWKYGHYAANRYRTRITLDNGIVTSWTTH